MNTPNPDYDRNQSSDIPKPLCYDLIRIWAEHAGAYMWDMNGVCIDLSCITNNDDEPLDRALEKWQKLYESKPLDPEYNPAWDSEDERARFDAAGQLLARQVYDFFNGTKTVIYYPTKGGETRWDALGKPPIRI